MKKNLKPRIARVLRAYFYMGWATSHKVAKSIVRDFCIPDVESALDPLSLGYKLQTLGLLPDNWKAIYYVDSEGDLNYRVIPRIHGDKVNSLFQVDWDGEEGAFEVRRLQDLPMCRHLRPEDLSWGKPHYDKWGNKITGFWVEP